jgi:hypothetical protein
LYVVLRIKKALKNKFFRAKYRDAPNGRVFLPVIAPFSSSIQTLTVGTGNEPVQS